jgi:hypothetical protein
MPENMENEAAVERECSEAACIHTRKIYDSCQARDCVEDLRFYPIQSAQPLIDSAVSVRPVRAELLYVYTEVQPVGLGRGYFTVNLRFHYRVTMEVLSGGCSRPMPVEGFAAFDKRAVLFGSEGTAKTFSSQSACQRLQMPLSLDNNLPVAVVEAVDPIFLSSRLVEVCDRPHELPLSEIPAGILSAFSEELLLGDIPGKRIYLTLGQFSILRLERDAQLLMPVYDYCMPEKECHCSEQREDPCELFGQVEFPTSDFFPPDSSGSIDPTKKFCNKT